MPGGYATAARYVLVTPSLRQYQFIRINMFNPYKKTERESVIAAAKASGQAAM